MNWNAVSEWVACVRFFASTDWVVTDDSTLSIGTTHSRARIFTFLVIAGQIRRAVAVANTFGSAIGRRTDHFVLTATLSLVIYNLALGIGACINKKNRRLKFSTFCLHLTLLILDSPQGEGTQGLDGSWITGSCGRAGKGWQRTNGSPVRSLGQLQIGLWWTTRQTAFSPQTPRQGSLHFWLIQAKDWEHSALD